ncbi:MAG TPA: acyltransferase [Smithella sp.]|mgnify:CR=1 FL=1|nr:hypothetical protein [Smithella sp.]MDM7986801.1 acyltransferase [Smithella sp.]HNY50841.1 acyltransferase [Smithella sp.]HOG90791.1 acyltransferase [Smithella sp.]HOU51807.1 acyltransferase [Smithella sp.]
MKISQIDNKTKSEYLENNYGKNIIPLSAAEQSMIGIEQTEVLLFYKKETSISKLKESLLKTIEHYNLFSSRLIMIDDNKFALQYCTDGFVINVLPSIDEPFDRINIEDIKKMMVRVKTLPGEPLFAVTGIPVKDGIFGGISCSHAISDGISLMLFLFSWMCIIEGKNFPLPSNQRLFKGKPVSIDRIDKAFIPPLSELSQEIQNRVKAGDIKTFSKREYFTYEFLTQIKNQAILENKKYILSNNQIITSCLLKKYHNHILPKTDKIFLKHPISIRDVNPDIDSFYIGNAVFVNLIEFTKNEIDTMSIPQIAYRLKESIHKIRNENFIKEISSFSRYGLEIKTDLYKKYPAANIDTDIVASNMTHLSDFESFGFSSNIGSIVHIGMPYYKTSFIMLKEKSDTIFAEITSIYPIP